MSPNATSTRPAWEQLGSAACGDRHESLVHLALVCRKRSQDLPLLPLGHLDGVKGAAELSSDFIELLWGDLKVAMRFLEANRRAPLSRGGVFERSAGHVADPEGAH